MNPDWLGIISAALSFIAYAHTDRFTGFSMPVSP
jgi:hypothetical protein